MTEFKYTNDKIRENHLILNNKLEIILHSSDIQNRKIDKILNILQQLQSIEELKR